MQEAAIQKPIRKTDGFTLVEVIVGMFILGIIFTSAFSTYQLGLNMIDDAREEIRASQIIQSEMERLRTKNWTQLQKMPSGATFKPSGEFAKIYATNYSAYRYLITLNPSDKMLVAIRVQWTNSAGKTSVRWFNTIFTKNGLNDDDYRKL